MSSIATLASTHQSSAGQEVGSDWMHDQDPSAHLGSCNCLITATIEYFQTTVHILQLSSSVSAKLFRGMHITTARIGPCMLKIPHSLWPLLLSSCMGYLSTCAN